MLDGSVPAFAPLPCAAVPSIRRCPALPVLPSTLAFRLPTSSVVLQPLLDRLIPEDEPKSFSGVCVRCPLHIKIPERHNVRDRLGSAFFDRNEMELIVDAPVVRDAIRRAVLEHRLWTGR